MNRKIKLVIAGTIALTIMGSLWWFTRPSPTDQALKGGSRQVRQLTDGKGVPVAVYQVKQGDMPVYLTGLGTVTPASMVTVTSRVDGQLMQLFFTEGQMVKAGQQLAQIDARSFNANLTQAQGQLAKNQAALENARQDLARFRTLAAQDSIAKQQVDAQAALVKQYQGAVQADKGAIAQARLQLEYSRISAPISGRVGLRKIDPGNMVRSGSTEGIVDIAQISPINVIFTLPQTQLGSILGKMQQGENMRAEVWDQGMTQKLGNGQVVTVDNQMDVTTGTVKIKASFDNEDLALFPNQFVNVRMFVEEIKQAILVPTEAIQHGSVGDYVWVMDKDKSAKIRTISRGFSNGEQTVVNQGLKAGETVIIDGFERLKEGQKVEPIDPKQAQQEAASAVEAKKKSKNTGGNKK